MNGSLIRYLLASVFIVMGISVITACGSEQADIPGSQVTLNQLAPITMVQTRLSTLVDKKLIQDPAAKLYQDTTETQVLGRIEIPSIGIKDWLVEGTEKDALTLGVGHMVQTAVPGMGGNFAVAGDRVLYTVPMLRIDKIQVGDPIYIYMPYANFYYQVDSINTVDPSDVSILANKGYESVTIISCDPPWQLFTRMAISAKMVNETPAV